MSYWGPGDRDYDDAVQDAAIEKDRERKLELWRMHGPEYYEDWMGEEEEDEDE